MINDRQGGMLYQPPQPQFAPPAPVKATSVLPAALKQTVSDEVRFQQLIYLVIPSMLKCVLLRSLSHAPMHSGHLFSSLR
jgi:hypothetical protein